MYYEWCEQFSDAATHAFGEVSQSPSAAGLGLEVLCSSDRVVCSGGCASRRTDGLV